MSVTDPIADMLTSIRNANMARLDKVTVPKSKIKIRILEILEGEGFIKGFKAVSNGSHESLVINLKFLDDRKPVILGIKRLSTPGLRQYVRHDKIPFVRSGMGTAILSTSQGLLTDKEARKRRIGGELICSVW